MKNDPILSAIINFLVPVIALYGLFFLVDFLKSGFSAFIYAVVLFVSGFMIYTVKFSSSKKSPFSEINFEFITFSLLLVFISYLVAAVIFLTDIFRI